MLKTKDKWPNYHGVHISGCTLNYTPILWVTGIDSGREPSSHRNVIMISSVAVGGLIGEVE